MDGMDSAHTVSYIGLDSRLKQSILWAPVD